MAFIDKPRAALRRVRGAFLVGALFAAATALATVTPAVAGGGGMHHMMGRNCFHGNFHRGGFHYFHRNFHRGFHYSYHRGHFNHYGRHRYARHFYGRRYYGRGYYGGGYYGGGYYQVGLGYGYGGYSAYPYVPYIPTYAPPVYAAPQPVYATPQPQPTATLPPPRQFDVYFDFDEYDLTPEGARVVDAAIAAAKEGGPAEIDITGNTDLAGTAAYNMVLSKRRAITVRNYMVAHGVDPSEISVHWLGKSNPAVPTADGVRDPRNRRVEIVITPEAPPTPPAMSMAPTEDQTGEAPEAVTMTAPVGAPANLVPSDD
jgi:outer membrane protein OmpA-like peptidoglycan-associated protein